jgi:FMN-dependent NADH-azoreductase
LSYLLSVTSSTRGDQSWSNRVLRAFLESFVAQHPDLDCRERATLEVPHLDLSAQRAGRIPVADQSPQEAAAFALAAELTGELEQASALVLATPMYNWGPPSSLKAWIDHIVNVQTFYRPSGLLHGLPVTCIVASGGFYSEGTNVAHDHLRPLLREIFSRIGVDDVAFIDCDPTGPMDRGLLDPNDPTSGFQRALAQVPAAASRRR